MSDFLLNLVRRSVGVAPAIRSRTIAPPAPLIEPAPAEVVAPETAAPSAVVAAEQHVQPSALPIVAPSTSMPAPLVQRFAVSTPLPQPVAPAPLVAAAAVPSEFAAPPVALLSPPELTTDPPFSRTCVLVPA